MYWIGNPCFHLYFHIGKCLHVLLKWLSETQTTFAHYSKKKAQIKTTYKGEYVQTNADVDFDYAGPLVKGAAVLW